MQITLTAPAIVAAAGVLTYALTSNGKLAEIGRLSFFAGLFTLLLHLR